MDKPPLVTIAVMCYNQREQCRAAVEGAFNQDYENLEIILSDDCSPDGTFAVLEELAHSYTGPHSVVLNCNAQNLGVTGHVNKLFELATGDMIAINAGDDISKPHRVSTLYNQYKINRPLLIHSAAEVIDVDGMATGKLVNRGEIVSKMSLRDAAFGRFLCLGASCAWNPDLMVDFDPISEMGAYEDLVFSFRAILAGKLEHIDEPLLQYRLGGISAVGEANSRVKTTPSAEEKQKAIVKRDQVYIKVLHQRLKDVFKFAPRNIELMRMITRRMVRFKKNHPWA